MELTNQIIHGEAAETLRSLPADCIDLVVTDPPYLCNYRDRTGRSIANDRNAAGVLPVFPELARVMSPDSLCVLFCGWTAISQFSVAWEAAGLRAVGQVVWRKAYSSSARHVQHRHESAWLLAKGRPQAPAKPLPDVLEWVYTGNRNHPTEKAVEIILPLVRSFSKPGDVVLDPFLGSGTTAVAAAFCGRRYLGVELEDRYCELARRRLAGVARYRRDNALAHEETGGVAA